MIRSLKLVALLLACDAHFLLTRNDDLPTLSRRRREWSRRIMHGMGIKLTVHGTPPTSGVVTGNHLSYIDIITYGAVIDGVFVSKEEVGHWPLIGLATKLAGSIFVNRRSRGKLTEVNEAIQKVLQRGLPVIFFPEGTTSDGSQVLRFNAGLFQSAVEEKVPIWPAAISYKINGSSEGVAEKVCYWGTMSFGPHVKQFLGLRNITAELTFAAEPVIPTGDRFDAANAAQAATAALAGLPMATPEDSAAMMKTAMADAENSSRFSPR